VGQLTVFSLASTCAAALSNVDIVSAPEVTATCIALDV